MIEFRFLSPELNQAIAELAEKNRQLIEEVAELRRRGGVCAHIISIRLPVPAELNLLRAKILEERSKAPDDQHWSFDDAVLEVRALAALQVKLVWQIEKMRPQVANLDA